MKRVAILAILAALGGCSTAPKIVDWDEEMQQKADEALAKYIEENRQVVFMPGGWQVMAYCKINTIEKAVEKKTTMLCKPPRHPNTDVTMKAQAFVVSKRLTTHPDHPAAWYVRFDNLSEHDICMNAQWRLMDIKPQDQLSEWQIVPARSRLGVGYMQQETWKIYGQDVRLEFSGHVSGLLVRPVVNNECYEVMDADEVRSDQ